MRDWQAKQPPREVLDLLGRQTDLEIAEARGLPVRMVRAARVARGIGRYRAPCGSAACYRRGCRCQPCRDAHAARIKRERKTRMSAAANP